MAAGSRSAPSAGSTALPRRPAADDHNSLAMLMRREGETLNALLRRLDKAIATVRNGGDPIDEING